LGEDYVGDSWWNKGMWEKLGLEPYTIPNRVRLKILSFGSGEKNQSELGQHFSIKSRSKIFMHGSIENFGAGSGWKSEVKVWSIRIRFLPAIDIAISFIERSKVERTKKVWLWEYTNFLHHYDFAEIILSPKNPEKLVKVGLFTKKDAIIFVTKSLPLSLIINCRNLGKERKNCPLKDFFANLPSHK